MDSVHSLPGSITDRPTPQWNNQPRAEAECAAGIFSSQADYSKSWDEGWLEVGDGHRLWYEQCGNPNGMPLLFIHGGPGNGFSSRHRELFDCSRLRLVFFDQRGCGRSTPGGALGGNTTAALVSDIEQLRLRLGISRWIVFGTSWGSALALAYCARHRRACLGTILRGVFLGRQEDIDWFFDQSAFLFPQQHQQLAARVPRGNGRLAQRICSAVLERPDEEALEIIRHWMQWERCLDHNHPAPLPELNEDQAVQALEKYRIQAHYLLNSCFLAAEQWKILAATFAGQLPVHLVHGRKDSVCRPKAALALHRRLPGSRMTWVENAGHNPFVPATRLALRIACATFLRQADNTVFSQSRLATGQRR